MDKMEFEYLRPGRFVDSDHPAVQAFAAAHALPKATQLQQAVALYYAVRDGILYDPYRVAPVPACYKASRCLEVGYGFCVTKAALLAAVARVAGIPARLGYADVRNHMTSMRLIEMMGTDLFAFHGYTELWLEGRWVKATPAFNLTLCQKAGVLPLEFDGRADSIFHPFDAGGRRHMEYVHERGSYADVPLQEIAAVWELLYPQSFIWGTAVDDADFQAEARAGI